MRTDHASPLPHPVTDEPLSRRTTTSRRVLAWIMVMVSTILLIVADHAGGFSYFLLGGAPVVWPDAQSVRFLSPSTFPEGSEADLLVRSAMGAWNVVPSTGFRYSFVRLDQDYPIDHFDGYSDTAAVPAAQLDPGVLGVTYLVNDGPYWFDADVLFSDLPQGVGYNFDLFPDCETLASPTPLHGYSFPLVALHELGHGIGLGHDPVGNESPTSSWFVATMNPRYPSGGTLGQQNIIELHTDDRNGARFLYPPSGISQPPIADLASAMYASGGIIGQAVALSFEPTSALPAARIRMTSVLENLGTTSELFVRQGFYLSQDEFVDVSDTLLGTLTWDIARGDAFEFDAIVTLPNDLPKGSYYLGTILDDINTVAEQYEDNNAAVYCRPLEVAQLRPVIHELGQFEAPCGETFRGPVPRVTHPLNMSPITWSLDQAPPDMTIHPATGVITWREPIPSPFLYVISVRATNEAGSNTQPLFLGVRGVAPGLRPPDDMTISCGEPFSGSAPTLIDPACMEPIIQWQLDEGPPGMVMDPATGALSWFNPEPSFDPYPVRVRAINAVGHATASWSLRAMPADFDGDGMITLIDYADVQPCLAGPGTTTALHCRCADLDADGDVDLQDAHQFAIRAGS